jgi:23S rRNA pseudouridine2605 synthase
MVLPRGLKRGAWLELDERDIRALMQAAGAEADGQRQRDGANAPRDSARGNQNGRRRAAGPGPRGNTDRSRGAGTARSQPDPLATAVTARRKPEGRPREAGAADGQPDPMKTSVGYIGADSFSRQRPGRPGAAPRRGGAGTGGGRRGGRSR